MKKFFPAIFLSFIFTALMVSQMLINGQELSASRVDKNQEKYAVYENQFRKLKANSSRGTKIDLETAKEPIVIINFWASWCRPCISEFKSLNMLVEKYKNKIRVIGINSDTENSKKIVEKIEKKYSLKFESLLDEDGELASLFNVTAIPSSIVYHKGKVLGFYNRETDFMADSFLSLLNDKVEL